MVDLMSREPPDPFDDRRAVIAAACVVGAVVIGAALAVALHLGWL